MKRSSSTFSRRKKWFKSLLVRIRTLFYKSEVIFLCLFFNGF
uniref:Uncharacterized protein n=1 Tax=Arundo donax TaxID=35708 RepID=A0A0A9GJ04_ARUDO